jgi:uncharacterized protein involved in outer membrane biogenesis
MRFLKKLIVIMLIIIVGLILAKNIIAKTAVTSGVKAMTGLDLKIGSMNIGFLSTSLGINDLKLYNPSGFKDKVMVDLPEAYVDYDLGAFLKNQVHLEEVRLNLKELVVVKNQAGELNLDSLKRAQSQGRSEKRTGDVESGEGKTPQIQIDVLKLAIGKVVYKDYSNPDQTVVKEYNINIDERFENITDPNTLVSLIMTKALMKTALRGFADFDTQQLREDAQAAAQKTKEAAAEEIDKARQVAQEAAEKAGQAAQEAAEKASKALEGLFPFGSEE